MGCVYSTASADGSDGHTFRVSNVDSQGVELNRGKIKVVASDLIFYQKGKEPINWPLRFLRRYGFDAELFSFESGRRCPTGPGIYAFKCRRAEDLFILVQETIHRAGEDDQLRRSGGSGSGGGSGGGSHFVFSRANVHTAGEPPPQNGFVLGSSLSEGQQGRGTSPGHHEELQYVNGSVDAHGTQYINTDRRSAAGAFQIDESAPLIGFMSHSGQLEGFNGRARVNYADLDLLSSMENIPGEEEHGLENFVRHAETSFILGSGLEAAALPAYDPDVFTNNAEDLGACPTYINIEVDEPSPPLSHRDDHTDQSSVLPNGEEGDGGGGLVVGGGGGLGVGDPIATNYANLPLHGPPSWAGAGKQEQKKHTAGYIQLDFQQSSSDSPGAGCTAGQSLSSPTGCVSLMETSSYAEIDFKKTEALCNSTRGGADGGDEPGARKTRHNSTIDM